MANQVDQSKYQENDDEALQSERPKSDWLARELADLFNARGMELLRNRSQSLAGLDFPELTFQDKPLLAKGAEAAPPKDGTAGGAKNDGKDAPAAKPADAKDGSDKVAAVPKAPVLTDGQQVMSQVQNILILKLAADQIAIPGKNSDLMKALRDSVQVEQAGIGAGGRPQWGAASQEVFKHYKDYLETRGVPSAMSDLSTMQLGTPTRSPEMLKNQNFSGATRPEHPMDFSNRMRRRETDWKLQTADASGQLVDVSNEKPPTQDVLNRIRSVESFLKWTQEEVVFDGKVRLQEKRLEEKIKAEGYPTSWLHHPLKEKDRYGWVSAVMERVEESNKLSFTLEAIFHLRSMDGMEKFGDDTLKNLPKHIKFATAVGPDGKERLKSIAMGHPPNLDLQNPEWQKSRKEEQDWLRGNSKEITQALNARVFANADRNNFLFQGDIETKGVQVLLDKKTNNVLGTFAPEDWADPKKRALLLPQGKTIDDVVVKDFDIIRCRMEVSEVRDPKSNELKQIKVDYTAQYGKAARLNYHNLIVEPIGNAARPSTSSKSPDGKLTFAPKDWVVVRGHGGEEKAMLAQDLQAHKDWEDLKRHSEAAVTVVMDGSMILAGAGAFRAGFSAVREAEAMSSALRSCQEGMQLMRAGKLTEGVFASAGFKMMAKGSAEVVLGATGAIRQEDLQAARSAYFLSGAVRGLPGLSKLNESVTKGLGFGRDGEMLRHAQELRGIKPGALAGLLEGTTAQGFQWSTRAMSLQMVGHLKDQYKAIEELGTPNGMKLAADRLRGIKLDETTRTPEQKRELDQQKLQTVDKMFQDYLKNQNVEHKEQVQKILDKTKELLAPIPAELVRPPVNQEALKKFETQRMQQTRAFLADLRENFLFDGKRSAAVEVQRATAFSVSTHHEFKKLQDKPVLIGSVALETENVEAAQKAFDAGANSDDALKLKIQLGNAKEQLREAQANAALDLRKLEKADPALEGQTPATKFQGKDDVRKAAALAYLLLAADKNGNLPADGTLHQSTIKIPAWKVQKTWSEVANDDDNGKKNDTVTQELSVQEREVLQTLKVGDLAELLTPDLVAKDSRGGDNPTSRQLNTADFLGRLGVISPAAHAAVLKNVLSGSGTTDEKNRAIADLGVLIKSVQGDEAKRAVGMDVGQRFLGAGDRFGNTSADLKKVLDDVARNTSTDKDVRAFASYYSNYVLNRKTGTPDDADVAFLKGALEKDVPGIKYEQYLEFMTARAGIEYGGNNNADLPQGPAGWDGRLRAAQALEQMIDTATGAGGVRFSQHDINARIAQCIDSSRPELSMHAAQALLGKVKQSRNSEASRLEMLDKEEPALAIEVREGLLKILQSGKPTGDEARDFVLRGTALELMPDFMKESTSDDKVLKSKLSALRVDAAKTLRSILYAGCADEVITLRDSLVASHRGNAPEAKVKEFQNRLRTAVREYATLYGAPKMSDDEAYLAALKGTVGRLPFGPEKAQRETRIAGLERDITLPVAVTPLFELNKAAFSDETMRYGAIQALTKMGAGDAETLRILRERATSPDGPGDVRLRVEPDAEVRMAAVRAMQKVMPALDFAQECNELLLTERNPAIASILRSNSFYADIALDPKSPQYQDKKSKAVEWFNIDATTGAVRGIEDLGSIFNRLVRTNEGAGEPDYGWLKGTALREQLKTTKEGVYGLNLLWQAQREGGHFDMNWAPGKPPAPSNNDQKRETKALEQSIEKYYTDLKTKILDVATSNGDKEQDAKARLEAQKLCYMLAAGIGTEGFEYDKNIDKAGRTPTKVNLSGEMALTIQIKAARALSDACAPGMIDRCVAGKYLMDALKRQDDPTVRRILLQGAENLMKSKFSVGDQVQEDRTMVANTPLVADRVYEVLADSMDRGHGDPVREKERAPFNAEAVQFLRRYSTPDEMRELLPKLDGLATSGVKTTSPIRQQLLELIADKRDRFMPVWNAAPEDTVNRDPQYRKSVLEQALADSKPGAYSGAIAEARMPSAVARIATAGKGEPFGADDPRVPLLLELATKGSIEKPRDERVRLAAAHALYLRCTDYKTRSEAMDEVVDVAVNGNRAGSRMDAADMMNKFGGAFIEKLETSLRSVEAGGTDSHMKESQRLALLGQVLARQGKDGEAEKVLLAALNGFRNKEKDAPLAFSSKKDVEDAFGKYKGVNDAERLRDVLAAMTALGKLRDTAGDRSVHYYTEEFRFDAMGFSHPDVIAGQTRLGDRMMERMDEARRLGREYSYLESAVDSYSQALRGMNTVGASTRDRTQLLEKMAEALREKSLQQRPLNFHMGSGPVPSQRSQTGDLDYAERCLKASLGMKEKNGSGFRNAEIASSYLQLAKIQSTRRTLDPTNAPAHRASSEASVSKALQIGRAQVQENPLGAADIIRAASDFYRGDTALSGALRDEASTIYDAHLGKGDLKGKTSAEVHQMLDGFKSTYGIESTLYGKLLVDASVHFRKDGRLTDAEEAASRAMDIYEKSGVGGAELKRALYAQGNATIDQGFGAYGRLVKPYEKLLPILEKEANGTMTPALKTCCTTLCAAHNSRAAYAMKTGNYGRAIEEATLVAGFNRRANDGKLNKYGTDVLSLVASQLEGKANDAFKKVPPELYTIESTVVPAMRLRQEYQDGKLSQHNVQAYTQYSKLLDERIKKATGEGNFLDVASALRIYSDLERQKNGGVLPVHVVNAVDSVWKAADAKAGQLGNGEGTPDEATTQKLVATGAALLEARRLLFELKKGRLDKEPSNETYQEDVDKISDLTARNVEWLKIQANRLPDKSENDQFVRSAHKSMDRTVDTFANSGSLYAPSLLSDAVDSYASKDRLNHMGQFIVENLPSVLSKSPTTAALLLSKTGQAPEARAITAVATVAAVQKWLGAQTPAIREQFIREHSGDLLNSLGDQIRDMKEFIATADGAAVTEGKKSHYESCIRTLEGVRKNFQAVTK